MVLRGISVWHSLLCGSEKNVRAKGSKWLQWNNTFQTGDSIHKTCANSTQSRWALRPTPNQRSYCQLIAAGRETLGFLALVSKLRSSGKVTHVRMHVQHRMDVTSAKIEERRSQSCLGTEGKAGSRKSFKSVWIDDLNILYKILIKIL